MRVYKYKKAGMLSHSLVIANSMKDAVVALGEPEEILFENSHAKVVLHGNLFQFEEELYQSIADLGRLELAVRGLLEKKTSGSHSQLETVYKDIIKRKLKK